MLEFKNLPFPNVIEQLDYNEILNNIKSVFKSYLNDDEISLLQSDNYSALLETLAYRELLLRARINQSVKSMLLPYAEGADLDNVVAIYGIERLMGEKPTAQVDLSLSTTLSASVYIPKDAVLRSEDGRQAVLKEAVTINAGELKAVATAVLDEYVKTSGIKCEYFQTPLPFVLKAKQLTEFSGGAERESDERLRERAVLSLQRFSTAGAAKAYVYHALSANAKVREAVALNGGAGTVDVYIKSEDESEQTRSSVAEYLNADMCRPLTDTVRVKNALKKTAVIRAELELTDMFLAQSISRELVPLSLNLGQDLNLSYIYSSLHKNGVYRVNLAEPKADVRAAENEFIAVSFEVSFKKAEL